MKLETYIMFVFYFACIVYIAKNATTIRCAEETDDAPEGDGEEGGSKPITWWVTGRDGEGEGQMGWTQYFIIFLLFIILVGIIGAIVVAVKVKK